MEYAHLAAGFSAALTVIGGAFGIGKLASAAMEASGRQPEAAGDIRTSMIIAAALIEGFTFFALVVTFMLATQAPKEAPVSKTAEKAVETTVKTPEAAK